MSDTKKKSCWVRGLCAFFAFSLSLFLVSCAKKAEWEIKSEKIIKDQKIQVRVRDDIPKSRVVPNLEPGVVTSLEDLPSTEIAPGVKARMIWGKFGLVSLLTLEPGAEIPRETLSCERIMVVRKGTVEQLVGESFVTMQAVEREVPDGTHGGTPRNEFVWLERGAEHALKAGDEGAEVIEVYSPARPDYLQKAGMKNPPGDLPEWNFPVPPSIQPNHVYDVYDLLFTELSPGANSRLISSRNAQLSFLTMSPGAKFALHVHPEEQVMVAFRGWIDEDILDGVSRMEKETTLLLPGNMVHGGTNGPLGCDALDVFWPPRPDYAEKMVARLEAYHSVIPEGAKVELVVDGAKDGPGLSFTEGPTWLGGRLYFSNMSFDQNWAGNPSKSAVVEMDPDGTYRYISEGKMLTNGTKPLPSGNLAVCDMFGHRIVEMTTAGKIVRTLVNEFDGKPLDGPNDLAIDAKGGIYFTDPQFTPETMKNQPGRSVYYLSPEGNVVRVIEPDEFAMPNGVALNPDGTTLYVNNTYDDEEWWNVDSDKDNFVWAYDVNEDGTLENGHKFAELFLTPDVLDRKGRSTSADGMTVDEQGNLYVCTYAGLQIFSPLGEFIGILNLPVFPVNCCFGGEDRQTLYITAYDRIYRVRTKVRGLEYSSYKQ